MSYLGLETVKPTKPMKRGDLYSFPITTIDQIVTDEKTNERLPEYLDKNFGMDLLWTNASPTSVFNSQTINVDLSEGNLFLMLFRENTTNQSMMYILFGEGAGFYVRFGSPAALPYRYNIMQRYTTITKSTMFISNCEQVNDTDPLNTSVNNFIIPYKIYRLRFGG